MLYRLLHNSLAFIGISWVDQDDVGWPVSVHDAGLLINSGLCDSEAFPPNWSKVINQASVLLFIIGDPAYRVTLWLIKPSVAVVD